VSVAAFIAGQRSAFDVPHATSCRALGVSQSWFYKWYNRPPTRRARRRAELADRIEKLFAETGRVYGSPRIVLDLRAEGWRVSVNTVAKIMAGRGLVARPKPRRRSLTQPGRRLAANDHVQRQFNSVAPNLLWCGDLTEVVTDEGKIYMASVLDLFSRRCIGHAFSAHLRRRPGPCRAGHGGSQPRRRRRGSDLPLRQGRRVHRRGLPGRLLPAGHHPVHGQGRVRFGQRRFGGVPLDHQGRIHPPPPLTWHIVVINRTTLPM